MKCTLCFKNMEINHWTKEEKEYLEDKWGVVSIPGLANRLGRSESAVKLKAQRMGLGRHSAAREEISCRELFWALGMGGESVSYSYTLKRWIEQYGFPIKKRGSVRTKFDFVSIEDFWKWAKNHQRILNFKNFEKHMLGSEEDWVDKKRAIDRMELHRTSPWTKDEDGILKTMLSQYRFSYRDLSKRLNRSEGAIKRRICDLKLKERPIRLPNKEWTEEEILVLMELYGKGHSFEYIADILERSALAVRGKLERLQNPDYMKRYNRDGKGTYNWTTTKAGKV